MTRWPGWVAGASLLFAAFTISGYFWTPCAAGLAAAAQLGLVCLIATGCGRLAVRRLGLTDISGSQKTLIGATLGLGLLSLTAFLLAFLHLLKPWPAALALAGLWVVGFTEMRELILSLGANRRLLGERPLAACAIAVLLGLVIWTAWVPPHQYDALVYHLALPQAYVRASGLVMVRDMIYPYFPQNGEMLFTLALLMKSDILAQMFMGLAAALSVWWLFEMGKREAPLSAVLLSCLLLASHSSVMLLSGTAYVEPLLMLWTTAAVLSFLRWRELSAADRSPRSWLVLSALFTGLALGTKYTAAITAVILSGELALRRRVRDLALYAGLSGVVFSPWLVKNVLTVGNPVFPFLYRWFPMTGTGWSAETARGYFQVLAEYGHPSGFWTELRRLPLLLLTNSPRFGGGMDVLGGLGWEACFWFLPLAVWAGWRNDFMRRVTVFCLCYLAAWFSTRVVLRFLIPIAPLLCLLAGCGIYGLWARLGRAGRWALGSAVGLLVLSHVLVFLYVQWGVFEAGSVLLGAETREQYLSRRLDYYPCARWAAERLDKNDRILIVGEQRGYYVEQDHTAATVHAPNRYVLWANASKDPGELARRIREEGYRTLLFVPREASRLAESVGSFTELGFRNWAGLRNGRLKVLFQGRACSLLSVEDSRP